MRFPLVILFTVAPAPAHPGVGFVMDSKVNVFDLDLQQVRRLGPDCGEGVFP